MKSYSRRVFSWLWLFLGIVYFFLPLLASFLFSLRGKKGVLSFVAYQHVFADPQFLKTFSFSLEMAVFTVIVGLALIVPTAIWIHLRVPKAKPLIDVFALLPFVIPPVILAFGLIRSYSRPPLAPRADPRASRRRLRDHRLPLHLPLHRRGPPRDGPARPHRSRAESGRGMGGHHFQGDPAQPAHGAAVGDIPHLRHRHRRAHAGRPPGMARLRPLHGPRRPQPAPTSRRRSRS